MQTCVTYYNLHTGTRTQTHINVNAALIHVKQSFKIAAGGFFIGLDALPDAEPTLSKY